MSTYVTYATMVARPPGLVGQQAWRITLASMPEEMISMIVSAREQSDEYILNAKDIGNLRLVNRRMRNYVQHEFGTRFFRLRNHMLSKYSLEALRDISQHPVLSIYVHYVSIGPERIPAELKDVYVYPLNAEATSNTQSLQSQPLLRIRGWTSGATRTRTGPGRVIMGRTEESLKEDLKSLSEDHKEFEKIGATRLLTESLQGFSKLQKFVIRSYPGPLIDSEGEKKYIGSPWTNPWGANSLVEEMNTALGCRPQFSIDPEVTFFTRGSRSNWYLDHILNALHAIRDRPDWTLEFEVNSSEEYTARRAAGDSPGRVFDLGPNSLWWAYKDRVRQISMHRTVWNLDGRHHARTDWLLQLFESCGSNVETLLCQNTTYWAAICIRAHLPMLRHLQVSYAAFHEAYFRKFLLNYSETLETIKLENVGITIEDMYNEWSPLPIRSLDAASWAACFNIMLKLRRLQSIDFSTLYYHTWLSSEALTENIPGKGEWDRSVTAKGERIKIVLEAAIRDRAIECDEKHTEIFGNANCILFAKDGPPQEENDVPGDDRAESSDDSSEMDI